MFSPPYSRFVFCSLLLLSALLSTSTSYSGAFQLWEESAAGTADYHAGGAAEAMDAGTTYYNPAGMVRLKQFQISLGGVYIPLDVNFNGSVGGGLVTPEPTEGYVAGNTRNLIPNFHLTFPINDRVFLGLGVTVPFGSATNFPGGVAPLNSVATLTKLETVNVNPNIALAINSFLSLGAGVDFLYAKAKYNSVSMGDLPFLNTLSRKDNYGWNAGVLLQFTDRTRAGVSYRSKIQVNAKGTSKLLNPDNTTLSQSNNLNANLSMPATTIYSIYSDLNEHWTFLASAYYTQWNVFEKIILNDTALVAVGLSNNIIVNENYRNTWNYALGAHYKVSSRITLKAGLGYDQTPTQDGYREVRLPDVNRIAAAIGSHFQATECVGLDLGWIHFFTKSAKVDNSLSGLDSFLITKGTARMNANVIGAQITVSFG